MGKLEAAQSTLEAGSGNPEELAAVFKSVITIVNSSSSPEVHSMGGEVLSAVRAGVVCGLYPGQSHAGFGSTSTHTQAWKARHWRLFSGWRPAFIQPLACRPSRC